MANFGYPYNHDLVICKDSTDYLYNHNETLIGIPCLCKDSHTKIAANLTQILNFKDNFHQEFELFSPRKIHANNGPMVDTLRLSA